MQPQPRLGGLVAEKRGAQHGQTLRDGQRAGALVTK